MKKRVAALLIASVIMSMAAGCTGKKDTKNSSKKNKTGEDPVSEITLDVPTVKRENGKQAVFELSAKSGTSLPTKKKCLIACSLSRTAVTRPVNSGPKTIYVESERLTQ